MVASCTSSRWQIGLPVAPGGGPACGAGAAVRAWGSGKLRPVCIWAKPSVERASGAASTAQARNHRERGLVSVRSISGH